MATKKTKKAVPKKPAVKKKIKNPAKKKAAPKRSIAKKKAKKASPGSRAASPVSIEEVTGIPCICRKGPDGWNCMKIEAGALVFCDGPFATKAECQEHRCE